MIGVLKRDIEIEWSGSGKRLLLPENAVIEGDRRDGYFYFKWRNSGNARLSEQFFTFPENVKWEPINKNIPRSAFHKGHVKSRGEKHAQAKLDRLKAEEIKKLLKTGQYYRQIAIKYRLSSACIQAIKEGRTWKAYEKESEKAETEKA